MNFNLITKMIDGDDYLWFEVNQLKTQFQCKFNMKVEKDFR